MNAWFCILNVWLPQGKNKLLLGSQVETMEAANTKKRLAALSEQLLADSVDVRDLGHGLLGSDSDSEDFVDDYALSGILVIVTVITEK
jgi:hypothetical protein